MSTEPSLPDTSPDRAAPTVTSGLKGEEEQGIASKPSMMGDVVSRLEEELERVRRKLRETVEKYEASIEELKVFTKELQAKNEELRSSTEELETSREKLQSITEEITTVKKDLKLKVEEVAQGNSDLQNLMASSNIATIFVDRELRIKRYTPSAVALFGLIDTDVGRPLSELRHQFDYGGMVDDASRVLEQMGVSEHEIRCRDGRWFLARMLPYRSAANNSAGVVLNFVEITALKSLEEAFQAVKKEKDADLAAMEWLQNLSNRLIATCELQPLFEQILSAAIEIQAGDCGMLQLWNRHSEMLEIVAHQGVEAEHLSRFGELSRQDVSTTSKRAWNERRRIVVEDVEQDPNLARQRDALQTHGIRSIHSIPLCGRSGEPLGVLSVKFKQPRKPAARELRLTDILARQAADLIELKVTAEDLRRFKNRLQRAVEIETVGILFLKNNGRISYVNDAFLQMSGYSRSDFEEGILAQAFFSSGVLDNGRGEGVIPDAGSNQKPHLATFERQFQRRDGSLWWALSTGTSIFDDEDALFFIDLTERKKAEEALLKSREELETSLRATEEARRVAEEADKVKERFIAVLSHELRTPLTPILIAVQSLLGDPDLSRDVKETLGMIERNVLLETRFINDLLDLTHINRGSLSMANQPLDLHEAVKNALEVCASDFEQKNHRLEVHLKAPRSRIKGDFDRLQQVFWNLLKNAVKFTPAGKEIRVSTYVEANEHICVTVTDTGIGIDGHHLEKIFKPFVQADSTINQNYGGLGLGLAISKVTIDAHGGKLKAHSEGHGRGSTFTVSFPLIS
ncbi:PAS domain S-box protein [Phragmitibacter flavus]|uniref:histidine kinase n=1 Tax=Phragmitibacter flavus TaxID=2576071 RepID=A0A5R8KGF3_9BACT|nr:ATP-binding protein [Phragmitibacter flavus]TLD71376.1 PAS domain S-box protein [Phragmitibacter flavus]